MQVVPVFTILVAFACVEGQPSEGSVPLAEEATAATARSLNFCEDIDKTDQLGFMGCLTALVPQAETLMKANGGNPQGFLNNICSKNGAGVEKQMLEILMTSENALQKCSALIQPHEQDEIVSETE